jgi:hypothetical protein
VTTIDEFFDRFDALKPTLADVGGETDDGSIVATDDVMHRAAAGLQPLYERLAERGGFDLAELGDKTRHRLALVPAVIIARSTSAQVLADEIHRCMTDIACESFLAGVAWEQARQMPAVD